MQTRIVLLLAAVLAVLALAAAPVRAEAAVAAVDAADEVDDTAESELFEEDEAELEAEDEEEDGDEAEDEAEDELDAEADDEFDAEDNGVVEAADVSEGAELLEVEVLPAHVLNAKCPKVESCPVCPGVAPVLHDRETRFAAKAYRYQFGDADAQADMTVRDTVRPAFLAGVAFADEAVRKAAKAGRTAYRHALELLDTHRHYKAVPKGCPKLPAKLECRCKPFTRLAHLAETKQKAMDYSAAQGDADEGFWWSMNEAVRDAFLEGVKYNDHERAIRASANEVEPHGDSEAEKVKNLQHAMDAINAREQAQRVPKDK